MKGAITYAMAEVHRPGFFDDAPQGVAFADCFAKVEGRSVVFVPHSPEHRARHGHTFAYDPNARADELHELLEQVFADADEEERAARIAFLQEHAGACLLGLAPSFEKCAILLGPGGNGKSTVAHAIYHGAMPDGTTAALPPHQWRKRFQIVKLLGVKANICHSDTPRTARWGYPFRSVISGEPVHAEYRYGKSFDARIRAGHVFCANALPATADLSVGFFRRIVIVHFGRHVDNAHRVVNLADNIIAQCRPGIVAWALQGAARLLARGEQGRYTVPPQSDVAVAEWRRRAEVA